MFILPSIRMVKTSCLSFECSTSSPERQAMPLQHNQPSQVLLPSRHTGDQDLVCSFSENLKQLFAFRTSHLPRNTHFSSVRLVWRQDLFLQFLSADFQGFAILQILQHFLCSPFIGRCPIFDRPHRQLLACRFLPFLPASPLASGAHPIALCWQLRAHSVLSSRRFQISYRPSCSHTSRYASMNF